MKITEKTSLEELALIVCKALKEEGVDAVLTGGAVVSIYTDNKYQSYDLDFISVSSKKSLEKAMSKIGFIKTKSRYFSHPDTDFYVEFPSPPLSIGNEPVDTFNEIESDIGYLKLLTPTHCVMDRLAAFYFWNDRQCLDQAIMVSKKHPVDFEIIQAWSKKEGELEKYDIFIKELSG